MATILNSAILDSNTAILDSDTLLSSLRFTENPLFPPWLWLKLIQSDSHSFSKLNDGSHLEYCHFEFGHIWFIHLSLSSQTDSHLPRLVPTICTKKTSLIHSDSTWWWQPFWILPCWIQTLPSWLQTPCYLLSDSLKNILTPFWLWLKLIQSDPKSFILTYLDDGSHLVFSILNSDILDSAILLKTRTAN